MPHTTPTIISRHGALLAVVITLLMPLAAVIVAAEPAQAGRPSSSRRSVSAGR